MVKSKRSSGYWLDRGLIFLKGLWYVLHIVQDFNFTFRLFKFCTYNSSIVNSKGGNPTIRLGNG